MRRYIVPLLAALGFALSSSIQPLCASAAPIASSNPAAVGAYAKVLRKINPQLPVWQSRDLAKHLLVNATRWKIDANMLVALVSVESAWHTHARSWAGAIGLGQLMPGTAANLHVDPADPYENLQGAARYLYGLLSRYRGKPNRYALTFAAYNAGPRAVAEYGGIPPYAETQEYVVRVMTAWQRINKVVHIPAQRVIRDAALAAGSASADLLYWTAASQ